MPCPLDTFSPYVKRQGSDVAYDEQYAALLDDIRNGVGRDEGQEQHAHASRHRAADPA